VLLLALAQVFLPGIAAERIESRLERYGRVAGVSVTAWPAIELLWGHADSVRVHALRLNLNTAQVPSSCGASPSPREAPACTRAR
jgi:hypothetical protein